MAHKKEDYVDKPAGKDDNFSVLVASIEVHELDKGKEQVRTTKNTKTEVQNATKREIISTELAEGVRIAVHDNVKEEKDR